MGVYPRFILTVTRLGHTLKSDIWFSSPLGQMLILPVGPGRVSFLAWEARLFSFRNYGIVRFPAGVKEPVRGVPTNWEFSACWGSGVRGGVRRTFLL
jgi:hypothetical protein